MSIMLSVLAMVLLQVNVNPALTPGVDNFPPLCNSIEATPTTVKRGEEVWLRANVAPPPRGITYSYRWFTREDGQEATFCEKAEAKLDTRGLSAGKHVVYVVVNDGRGNAVECSAEITVNES